LRIHVRDRAIKEHLQQFIEAIYIERDYTPLRIVRDLGQRTVERRIHIGGGAVQLLADAARRTTTQSLLQNKIVAGVIGLGGIIHRLPRFARRSRSRMVARSKRGISTCAIRASRARARKGKPATLLTLFAAGRERLR